MPSKPQEVCFCGMLLQHHCVFLPCLGIPCGPILPGAPCRPTLAPSYGAGSTARSASRHVWPPRCAIGAIRHRRPLLAGTSSPSGSLKSPLALLTAMMPTVSGTIPGFSAASSGSRSIRRKTWRGPRPARGSHPGGPAPTSPGSRRRSSIIAWRAPPRPPPPWSSTSSPRRTRPLVSRT